MERILETLGRFLKWKKKQINDLNLYKKAHKKEFSQHGQMTVT